VVLASVLLGLSPGCNSQTAPAPSGVRGPGVQAHVRIYVSNERSNDVSVIDPSSNRVVATIPVGKRPRGIQVTRDNRSVFVALSGSPIAGPGVKDQDLPPADKAADGIALIDVATGQFKEKINSGSDP